MISKKTNSGATAVKTVVSACVTTSSSCRWTIWSNTAAEAVAHNINHHGDSNNLHGRLQFGADLELFPPDRHRFAARNVAAVVVIGTEGGWTQRWLTALPPRAKPVIGNFGIEGHGDHETIRRLCRCEEILQDASELHRVECPISGLLDFNQVRRIGQPPAAVPTRRLAIRSTNSIPLKTTLLFGETSEITGGEKLLETRCRSPKVWKDFP